MNFIIWEKIEKRCFTELVNEAEGIIIIFCV